MGNEAGGNPIEGMQGGEYAETLAAAMAGLADGFDLLMEDADSAAGTRTSEPGSGRSRRRCPSPSSIPNLTTRQGVANGDVEVFRN